MDTNNKSLKSDPLLSELAGRHRKLARLVWLLADAKGVAAELELDCVEDVLQDLTDAAFEAWSELKPAVDALEVKLYTAGESLDAGYEN